MTVIYAIVIFCVLIFVHELGHFIVAKACDVKVNEFSIGMGPAFFKKQKGETLYSLRAFPIGGYCAMEGEDEDSEEPRAFNNKKPLQRAAILFAGAFMNFLTCVVLLIILSLYVGNGTTTIDKVFDGSPAQAGGLKPGDRIVAVDDKEIETWDDVIATLSGSDGKAVEIKVDRDEIVTLTVKPELDEKSKRMMIGIAPVLEHSVGYAITDGIKDTKNMAVLMYSTIKDLFTGDVSVKELSGPVGIIYATNQAAKAGVIYVIYLGALLSLNLAIVNLLPFPALDGGRILFLIIRQFTGKRVSEETEGKIHFIGICLLFALMIYVTFNDVLRFIIPIF